MASLASNSDSAPKNLRRYGLTLDKFAVFESVYKDNFYEFLWSLNVATQLCAVNGQFVVLMSCNIHI